MNCAALIELCQQDCMVLEDIKEHLTKARKLTKKINQKKATDMDIVDKLCEVIISISIEWAKLQEKWDMSTLKPSHGEDDFFKPETPYDMFIRQLFIFAKENSTWRKDNMTLEGSPSIAAFYVNEIWKAINQATEIATKGATEGWEDVWD